MPKQEEPPYIETRPLDDDNVPLKFAGDHFSEWYALELVKNTFSQYETYRTQSHDPRWNLNDMLYAKFVPPRNWPGTDIPRSNLGYGLVFEQIEAAKPHIAQALFGNPEWFSIEADVGSNPEAARAQTAHLAYAYDKTSEKRGTTPTGEFMLCLTDMLLYGDGGVHIEYDPDHMMPSFTRIDPRDLYVDPYTQGPSIDGARSVIWRRFMTLEDIKQFRNDKRMHVPTDPELFSMSQGYQSAQADLTKQTAEATRGVQYSAITASFAATLPTHNQIEVLVYYSKSKIIWILNRQWVMFNSLNPYGFIPVCMAPCFPWPGRFYAMSMADVVEGYQRYVEALFNARLDTVHMQLFPPRAVPQGFLVTPQQQKWGPGAQFGVADPSAYQMLQVADSTSNIYQELGFIQSAADRNTGVGPMASGQPTPSNANRTAGGVNAQLQGATLRLYPMVKNFEDYLIIPLVQKSSKMVRVHARMGDQLAGRVRDQQNPDEFKYVQVSAQAFLEDTRVRVTASSKMLTRERISQQFPFIAQTLLQGPMLNALSQAGYTVDFMQFTRMMMDATGIDRYYNLIRPFNEEEKKAQQEQQQQAENIGKEGEMQKAQLDAQTRLQMGQMKMQAESEKNQTAMQIAQMKKQPSPEEAAAKQQETQQKMQQKQEEGQLKVWLEQMKIQMKQKELEMKLQMQRQKTAADAQKAQMDMQIKARSADTDARIAQFRHAQQLQQETISAATQSQQMQQKNALDLDHKTKLNEIKERTSLKMNDKGRPKE